MKAVDLIIVAPTYNEGKVAKKVIEEWHTELNKLGISNYKFLLIDDGSTDETSEIASSAKIPKQNLIIYNKPNTGHGRSCILGYKKALSYNPRWVLQIDSDDQCDPCFFKEFWDKREKQQVIYGFRKTRDDGWFRLVASRLISLYIYLFTLKYCKDPNVPYRLYSNKALSKVIDLNYDVNLSNMLLTYRIQETYCIQWVSIHFRDRLQGSSSHKIIKSLALIGQIIIRLLNDK